MPITHQLNLEQSIAFAAVPGTYPDDVSGVLHFHFSRFEPYKGIGVE